MIQTIGRAARNDRGKVIMYADVMTGSMEQAIDETSRRRSIQLEYNKAHGITPRTILKSKEAIMEQTSVADSKPRKVYVEPTEIRIAADPVVKYMGKSDLQKLMAETQRKMESAAKDLDFLEAARLRDELMQLKEQLKAKS
jgi:excinuclease ABC subunit B